MKWIQDFSRQATRARRVRSLLSPECRRILVALTAAWLGPLGPAAAGDAAPTPWLTGTALQDQLARPVDVYWSDTPLREAVYNLSRSRRVAVLLDRRVDPDQRIDLQLKDVSAEAILRQVAKSRRLGVSRLGPLFYLGPVRFTSRLRTLVQLRREEVRDLPREAVARFVEPEPMRWDDFATPRDLLAQLVAESGIEIWGLEQVPHDLWAGGDLPPLALVDRISLIAGQFDLTFQVVGDGDGIRLVPLPEEVAIVRSYPAGTSPGKLVGQWAALLPGSQIKLVGEKIFVKGLLEDHERIAAGERPPRRQTHRPAGRGKGETRVTVREAKGPLGPVLEQLAQRLQLEMKIDREALRRAGISLEQQVSFSVREATYDELFRAVLGPVGCTYRRHGNTIEVMPAK